MMRKNSSYFFEDNFEIIKCEFQLIFEKSRIKKIKTSDNEPYFTIYITNICIIRPNIHKEDCNEGKAILNGNGLTVVNHFYSFFTNFNDKNKFEISRMNTMRDYYKFSDLKYRPELDFVSNEKRGSEKFTIIKIPTITFQYKDSTYENCKEHIDIICKFISFCYGIRVEYKKLIYRTDESIYIYLNNEKRENRYITKLSTIFHSLEKNYSIEKILKTNWHISYLQKKVKLNKAIDNLLHSREIESSAKYLLLFNIIEIFNTNQSIERFQSNNLKDINMKKAQILIEGTLSDNEDLDLFRKKWDGIINKIFIKPLVSPLEETLKLNNINPEEFGLSFKELKSVRDKLTHGSTNSLNEEKLKDYIIAMRKICICLILSQLGFGNEITIKN